MKKSISTHHPCPSCQKPMMPVVIRCECCDLELRGKMEPNAFTHLSSEWLHFLHVFIHCEGRIGDMEKALGVSYPTVKGKIQKLKTMVTPQDEGHHEKESPTQSIMGTLAAMDAGEIDYSEGLQLIKKLRKEIK